MMGGRRSGSARWLPSSVVLPTWSTFRPAISRARRSWQAVEPAVSGVVAEIDVRAVGIAIVNLGGGRPGEDDVVDHSVGLTEVAALGERVEPGGRPLALVHASEEDSARRAAAAVRSAFVVSDAAPDVPGPVVEVQRTV